MADNQVTTIKHIEDKMLDMNGEEYVQHLFEAEVNGQMFRDAIVLPKQDFEKLSVDELNNLKKERVENYRALLDNPQDTTTGVEPTT